MAHVLPPIRINKHLTKVELFSSTSQSLINLWLNYMLNIFLNEILTLSCLKKQQCSVDVKEGICEADKKNKA